VSTNTGNVWNQTILPPGNWLAVASSADGATLAAAIYGGYIYVSTNSGATWNTNTTLLRRNWASLALSADGSQMVAAEYGGLIYVYTNSVVKRTGSAPIKSWNSICSSSNGKILAATAYDGTSISTNYGSTWITTNIFGNSIACSADGTRLVIAGDQIWTSTNSGMTWVTNNAPNSPQGWYGVASSADGCKLVAANRFFMGIWVEQITPSPQLNMRPTNGNLAFSWTVPSTNFVLQQNSDLNTTSWTTVTNLPVLNLTNLQEEVGVSPANGSSFFRLIAQ
jgi:hypothetical protein